MTNINIDLGAKELISILENNGYEAYVVGGCVRDSLIGKIPKDWDITTNATPEQIKNVFKEYKVIPTGEKYGTITVMLNNTPYEITTYRKDGNYSDGRRPDKVEFTSNIIEDLSRRDFTINAIAYNDKNGFVDPFNGITDLKNKIIRCVGNAEDRFLEDSLRVMRCCRFALKYKFTIEEKTLIAMNNNVKNLKNVSMERINNELKQILSYEICAYDYVYYVEKIILHLIPELKTCIGFIQNNPYHWTDVYNHIISSFLFTDNNDYVIKISLLLHDIAKPKCYTEDKDGIGHFYGHAEESSSMARHILKRLKFDNNTVDTVCNLIKYHDRELSGKQSIKRLLRLISNEEFDMLMDIKYADIKAQSYKYFYDRLDKLNKIIKLKKEIINKKEAFSIKDLNINGKDLIDTFGLEQSKEIGVMLNSCLNAVINEDVMNRKDELLDYVISEFFSE